MGMLVAKEADGLHFCMIGNGAQGQTGCISGMGANISLHSQPQRCRMISMVIETVNINVGNRAILTFKVSLAVSGRKLTTQVELESVHGDKYENTSNMKDEQLRHYGITANDLGWAKDMAEDVARGRVPRIDAEMP